MAIIFVRYHLSRGETRYAWIVAGGVVLQIVVLSLIPASLKSIVWANVAIAASPVEHARNPRGTPAPAGRSALAPFLRNGWAP